MKKLNPPRNIQLRNPPYDGRTNTEKLMDSGVVENEVQRNADKNRSFFGCQPRPKEFQPFFRYGGVETGATDKPNSRAIISCGKDVGQPTKLSYYMENQGIKFK